MSPSLADVTIPLVSGYQRLWTTTGIVGGWILVVLGLSYYARRRIGVARWRTLHRFTALGWLLGVLHGAVRGHRRGRRVVPDRGRGRGAARVRAADRAPGRCAFLACGSTLMSAEAIERFACFGGTCEVRVTGRDGARAAARARRRLLDWHDRFSRFLPSSELSRLNADPRAAVPASPTMLALAVAVAAAGERTGGLVDGTLGAEIAAAGYRAPRRTGATLPLPLALRLSPPRRPAGPSPHARWRTVEADRAARLVRRPPGTVIDSGGLAKGLFADLLADELTGRPGFVLSCAGDLRIRGAHPRPVCVASPFGEQVLHTFLLTDAAVATSGITARSWFDPSGAPAHHLLDPATGAPAFTGVVQATAIAPTAFEAELRAKAALLSGPDRARGWLLPHGGVVVRDDAGHEVIAGTATA